MVSNDVLKLRQSDDQCAEAQKQHRVEAFASIAQGSLRWWVEHDFVPVPIMSPIGSRRRSRRIACVTALHIHRIELPLLSIATTVTEGTWQILVKATWKQCVDATIWSGLRIWHLLHSAVVSCKT